MRVRVDSTAKPHLSRIERRGLRLLRSNDALSKDEVKNKKM